MKLGRAVAYLLLTAVLFAAVLIPAMQWNILYAKRRKPVIVPPLTPPVLAVLYLVLALVTALAFALMK